MVEKKDVVTRQRKWQLENPDKHKEAVKHWWGTVKGKMLSRHWTAMSRKGMHTGRLPCNYCKEKK